MSEDAHPRSTKMESERVRRNLAAYKYSSPTKSLCERLFLVRFWNWFTEFLPRNIAPNVLTLTGFAASLVAWGIIVIHSPDLSGATPTSLYPLLAFLLFLYQTMDGCDGPQARRLSCGSALGELVDHGVDAVVTTIDVFVLFEILGFSLNNGAILIAIVGSQVAFVLSNMTLLHMGRQVFNEIDCQEAQIIIQCLLVGTWVYYDVLDAESREYPALSQLALPLPGVVDAVVSHLPSADDFRVDEASEAGMGTYQFRWLFIAVGAIATTWGNTTTLFARIALRYTSSKSQTTEQTHVEGDERIGAGLLWRQALACIVWSVLVVASWTLIADTEDTGVWPLWMLLVTFAFGNFALNNLVIRVTKTPLPNIFYIPSFRIVALWCVLAYFVPRENPLVYWCALCVPAAAAVLQEVDYSMRLAGHITEALKIPFWTVPKKK